MLQLAALWSAAYLSMFTFADTALSAITAPPPQPSCDPASPWLWFAYIHYLIQRPPQTLLPKLPSHDKTREEQSHRFGHPTTHILPRIHTHDLQNTWQKSRSHHTSACHLGNPLSLVGPQRLLYHHPFAQDQYPSMCTVFVCVCIYICVMARAKPYREGSYVYLYLRNELVLLNNKNPYPNPCAVNTEKELLGAVLSGINLKGHGAWQTFKH